MKSCRVCKAEFQPRSTMQACCSPPCALEYARERTRSRERRETRKWVRSERDRIKTRSEWLREAQKEFNAYVRRRDAGKPCVCCGRPLEDNTYGGKVDAGHYRSIGAAPHLRFNEDNCHAQAVYCNRDRSGNAVEYRLGLIRRIGLARVEALESSNEVHRWTIEELKSIKAEYRRKLKEMQQ